MILLQRLHFDEDVNRIRRYVYDDESVKPPQRRRNGFIVWNRSKLMTDVKHLEDFISNIWPL